MPLLRPLPRLGRQSCRQLASSSRDKERETRALLDRIIRSVAYMWAMFDVKQCPVGVWEYFYRNIFWNCAALLIMVLF